MAINLEFVNLEDTVFFITTNRLGELDVDSGVIKEVTEKSSGAHSVVLEIEDSIDDVMVHHHSRSFLITDIFETAGQAVSDLEEDVLDIKTKNVEALVKVREKHSLAPSTEPKKLVSK